MPPEKDFRVALQRYIGSIRSNITIVVRATCQQMAVSKAEAEMPGWGFTKKRQK